MMLEEIAVDMGPFLSVMTFVIVVSTFAFTMVSSAGADNGYADLHGSLFVAYSLSLGDFEQDTYTDNGLMTVVFVYFTLFVNVILFNVLIAIISDTFERVMETAGHRVLAQKADLLLSMQKIMRKAERGRTDWFPAWLHVAERVTEGQDAEGGWKGKLDAFKAAVKTEVGAVQAEVGAIQANQAEMKAEMKANQAEMKANQAKMEAGIAELKSMLQSQLTQQLVEATDVVVDEA